MRTIHTFRLLPAYFAIVALLAGAPKEARKKVAPQPAGTVTAVLWRDPGDLPRRDLFYGPGGKEHQPRPPYTFVKEDVGGTNPKYVVRDADGVKWTVKLGVEAKPETAASRLTWAVGYAANEDYFVPALRIDKVPRYLKRGAGLIGPDGSMRDARLKRSPEELEKVGNWRWRDNPFSRTRELNGLRVLMALLGNWDVKDDNNAIYQLRKSPSPGSVERIYLVSDLGATFGSTGAGFSPGHSKGNLAAYRRSKFIASARADSIDFTSPSHPSLFSPKNIPYFFMWLRMRWIGKHVPRADARWTGDLLGRLSHAQIRDAFRAAGYLPAEIDGFTEVVERRIAQLREL